MHCFINDSYLDADFNCLFLHISAVDDAHKTNGSAKHGAGEDDAEVN